MQKVHQGERPGQVPRLRDAPPQADAAARRRRLDGDGVVDGLLHDRVPRVPLVASVCVDVPIIDGERRGGGDGRHAPRVNFVTGASAGNSPLTAELTDAN